MAVRIIVNDRYFLLAFGWKLKTNTRKKSEISRKILGKEKEAQVSAQILKYEKQFFSPLALVICLSVYPRAVQWTR